jgi:hypothetical protein
MDSFLDIIIVNWNSGENLRGCLESILTSTKDSLELRHVVVVDNASSDNSMDGLDGIGLPLTIIRNKENRGFGVACNQGAKGSSADYLLFLNPDTRLFPDSLWKPIEFMEKPENSKVGICGVQLVDEQRRVGRTCARFPTPSLFLSKMLGLDRLLAKYFQSYFMDDWDHAQSRSVDHVTGAFYLVRRKLFESLDGFDERFFVYLEDLDFSYRAKKAGWDSYYLAETRAYHKGGGSSEKVKATRLFYSLRSRILYGYKHFDWFSATILALGTLLVEPFTRLTLACARFSGEEMLEALRGYWMLWSAFPKLAGIIRERSKYENSFA